LERALRRHVVDDDQHLPEAGALRCAPAAFAGDELELVLPTAPHHERFEQTVLFDRLRQLVQPLVVDALPRLALLRDDLVERALEDVVFAIALAGARRGRLRRGRGQKGVEAPAKTSLGA